MTDQQEGYGAQTAWRAIQEFLPEEYWLKPANMPVEEWWDWRGHCIHLDRFRNPNAPIRVILFHGVGTNGRQMSTILGGPLARSGFETVAVDMPGYGVTKVARGVTVTYDDWVAAANAFIDTELARDPRPIILYGLSAGGMLTYYAAAMNRKVKGIVGMTFLDQRVQQVADETAYSKLMNRVGMPQVRLAAKIGLGWLKVPMRLVSKMSGMAATMAARPRSFAHPARSVHLPSGGRRGGKGSSQPPAWIELSPRMPEVMPDRRADPRCGSGNDGHARRWHATPHWRSRPRCR